MQQRCRLTGRPGLTFETHRQQKALECQHPNWPRLSGPFCPILTDCSHRSVTLWTAVVLVQSCQDEQWLTFPPSGRFSAAAAAGVFGRSGRTPTTIPLHPQYHHHQRQVAAARPQVSKANKAGRPHANRPPASNTYPCRPGEAGQGRASSVQAPIPSCYQPGIDS